jgi:hypothetical protein
MWNLISVRLDTLLLSVYLEVVVMLCKIGARFAPNVPWAQKSLWMHPMELLGHVCHVETHFSPFRDSVSVGARQVHDLL